MSSGRREAPSPPGPRQKEMSDARGMAIIGPMCTGKTTAGRRAADLLGVPFIDLDVVWRSSQEELGYDDDQIRRLHEDSGYDAVRRYVEPYEVLLVERALRQHAGGIVGFGAGHAALDARAADERRVVQALSGWKVVLLTPSSEPQTSLEILDARITNSEVPADLHGVAREMNREFVQSASMHRLATDVLCTSSDTIDEVAASIVQLFVSGQAKA